VRAIPYFFSCLFYLIVSLAFSTEVNAQTSSPYSSEKGYFTANFSKICDGGEVTFNIQGCNDAGARVELSWKYASNTNAAPISISNDVGILEDLTYIIPEVSSDSLNPKIIIYADFNTNCFGEGNQDDYMEFQIINQPIFEIQNCDDNKVQFNIIEPRNTEYESFRFQVESSGIPGGFVTLPSNPHTVTFNSGGPYSTTIKIASITSKVPSGQPSVSCGIISSAFDVTPRQLISKPSNLVFENTNPAIINDEVIISGLFELGTNYAVTYPDQGGQQDILIGDGTSDQAHVFAPIENNYSRIKVFAKSPCAPSDDSRVSGYLYPIPIESGGNQSGGQGIQFKISSAFEGDLYLIKNGTQYKQLDFQAGSDIFTTSLAIDESVSCGEENTYQIKAVTEGTGEISLSAPLSITAGPSSTARPIDDITTAWEGMTVKAYAVPALNEQTLTVYNSQGNQIAQAKADTISFRYDTTIGTYFMSRTDNCGNNTATPKEFTPIYLQNTSNQLQTVSLLWNEYVGFNEGVAQYTVQQNLGNGWVDLHSSNSTLTTYIVNKEFGVEDIGTQFRILIKSEGSPSYESYSYIYTYEPEIVGYFPNAFSPNFDGKNDTFGIIGRFVTSCELTIFDRWGSPIYSGSKEGITFKEGTDIQDEVVWDGMIRSGQPAPPGTYSYKAVYTTVDNKQHHAHGYVLLTK
jgi:gliding motility-associated-like protein